jgi:hypothetical protein
MIHYIDTLSFVIASGIVRPVLVLFGMHLTSTSQTLGVDHIKYSSPGPNQSRAHSAIARFGQALS